MVRIRPAREGRGKQYEQLTPFEAATLSKTGIALGYEPLRWGEEMENAHDGCHIAIATPVAVQMTNWMDTERDYVYGDNEVLGGNATQRRRYVQAKQWRPWKALSQQDRDFMLSLVWVPEEPRSPLEALASVE